MSDIKLFRLGHRRRSERASKLAVRPHIEALVTEQEKQVTLLP